MIHHKLTKILRHKEYIYLVSFGFSDGSISPEKDQYEYQPDFSHDIPADQEVEKLRFHLWKPVFDDV